VAQPLAQLGKLINFEVVVLDDRLSMPTKTLSAGRPVLAQPFKKPFITGRLTTIRMSSWSRAATATMSKPC
jgi:hypothetical protein